MKKIFLALFALVGTMSMNAQVMKVVKNGEEVAKYNGVDYEFVFEEAKASTTTGTAKATIGGSEVNVNWVQLWENGPKFAEYNVGVTDGKAESCGGYYCWGSSINKDSNRAYKDGTAALTGTDDTATNLWGSNWRMPSQAELQALLDNCDVEECAVNGVNGRKFTGKNDYASNSVFLPAAGGYGNGNVNGQGTLGYYWSTSPDGKFYAYDLRFYSGSLSVLGSDRGYGFSVRAVLVENSAATSYNEGPITIGDGSGIELGEENW